MGSLGRSQNIRITRILDPDIPDGGGCPKMIELYVSGTVDLGNYDLVRAANGQSFGASSSDRRNLSGTYSDAFVYLYFSTCGGASVVEAFPSLNGAPLISMSNVSGNGDDAFRVEERQSGQVIDQVLDESGTVLYLNGCIRRKNGTGPDGGWQPGHWEACDRSGGNGTDILIGLEGEPLAAAVGLGDFGFGVAPVSWLELKARQVSGGLLLNWATASETNNAYFEIERKGPEQAFQTIGRIAGKGTTTSLSVYQYLDPRPLREGAIYRLRQVDTDGGYSFSSWVYGGPVWVQAAPVLNNPFGEHLQLNPAYRDMRGGKLALLLPDGRMVLSESWGPGQMPAKIATAHLAQGMYLAQWQEEGQPPQWQRLVKP